MKPLCSHMICFPCFQLAAERFVNYWESRRQVFGKDFTLPMTLTGALRHDLAALQVGVYRLLPPDSYGRQVLFIEPHLNTNVNYSLESLVSVRRLYMKLE